MLWLVNISLLQSSKSIFVCACRRLSCLRTMSFLVISRFAQSLQEFSSSPVCPTLTLFIISGRFPRRENNKFVQPVTFFWAKQIKIICHNLLASLQVVQIQPERGCLGPGECAICILTFISDYPTVYQLDLICQVPKCGSRFKDAVLITTTGLNVLWGFYVIDQNQTNASLLIGRKMLQISFLTNKNLKRVACICCHNPLLW